LIPFYDSLVHEVVLDDVSSCSFFRSLAMIGKLFVVAILHALVAGLVYWWTRPISLPLREHPDKEYDYIIGMYGHPAVGLDDCWTKSISLPLRDQ
jgi:hypothetical protein